jgi:hypothetical protein
MTEEQKRNIAAIKKKLEEINAESRQRLLK